MPVIIKLEDLDEGYVLKNIKEGKIIIYPTDTNYGLGCNALDNNVVRKVRDIKKSNQPFSVIAPSKRWIYTNLEANKAYVQKLPGPFTFIFKIKKYDLVSPDVTNTNFLGVRIPRHIFTKVLQKSKLPILTTSASISKRKVVRKIKDIPRKVMKNVDIVIDGGELEEKQSVILDFTKNIVRIVKRW
jgi:tRNA threonylcarbamoyl adenosine modification protein (Sua5/YciO/YrdC/YwlC family)